MIYLDSADEHDARRAADLGFITGITTNPTLIAQTGRPALEQIGRLLGVFPGLVFHQVQRTDQDGAWEEAQSVRALAGERVVLKLPATLACYQLGARLVADGAAVAMTAVYGAGQAVLAAQVGARWVIPYVDRARRLLGDDADVLGELATVLRPIPGRPRILAASLKSPQQVSQAFRQGADEVTLALALIEDLAEHPLSQRAIADFAVDPRPSTTQ